MNNEILILSTTAATIGVIHTALGPDHYLPFVALSKARNWSIFKTIWVTVICGLGHVGSSILLGAIGVIAGIGVSHLEFVESIRGDWAAWAFLFLGLGYMAWGLNRASMNKLHKHIDTNGNEFTHHHGNEKKRKNRELSIKFLFIVFVLGPCEPLIPILMYPAAKESTFGLIMVSSIFAIATIFTMTVIVVALTYGFKFIKLSGLERYTHALAGGTIALSGALILIGL